jgi:hypothetical protein
MNTWQHRSSQEFITISLRSPFSASPREINLENQVLTEERERRIS